MPSKGPLKINCIASMISASLTVTNPASPSQMARKVISEMVRLLQNLEVAIAGH